MHLADAEIYKMAFSNQALVSGGCQDLIAFGVSRYHVSEDFFPTTLVGRLYELVAVNTTFL
jgi:hypothetical protein